MRIVRRKKPYDFADARSWIENWIADTEAARWRTPQDIKTGFT